MSVAFSSGDLSTVLCPVLKEPDEICLIGSTYHCPAANIGTPFLGIEVQGLYCNLGLYGSHQKGGGVSRGALTIACVKALLPACVLLSSASD